MRVLYPYRDFGYCFKGLGMNSGSEITVRNTAFTDEELLEAVAAFTANGNNKKKAAESLGMAVTSFKRRIARAAEKGLLGFKPVLPGFVVTKTSVTTNGDGDVKSQTIAQKREPDEAEGGVPFEMPAGHILGKGTFHIAPDGAIKQSWLKTRLDQLDPEYVIARFKEAFKEYEGRAVAADPPTYHDDNYLNLIPCNDWHINLLTWWREVGESWDLKIAERVIGETVATVIASARRAKTAVVLGGGDLMHNDDNTNRTAKSGNILDADGRHAKGQEAVLRLLVHTIDTALLYNDNVICRFLKGNHDENSTAGIALFIYAWYRNEPRVKVDLDQSLFWFYEFGKVMLGATHGHAAKLKDMPQIMAARRPEMWGRTKFRYAHGFHVHHKEVGGKEEGGAYWESHQAPIPQDSWHYGEGFLSGRSVQVITYHKDLGEHGRRREPILDALITKPTNFLAEAA